MHSIFTEKTRNWFLSSVGTPTEAQTLAFSAVASGKDVLVSSPTGSGKTLAAFLYFLDGFLRRSEEGALPSETEILYITPLKALGNDIRENLSRPIEGLGLKTIVRTAIRNGDTTPSERQAILRKPPHILITTPESLYLLLSSASGQKVLKTVKHVILDEFHATVSTKRGVHMMLSLARLDALCGQRAQRIALSATLAPLETAKQILSGEGECIIVAPESNKKTQLIVDTAVPDMRILPENSIWPHLADRVTEATKDSKCVLAFCDGRASCERLAHKINERAGETLARTHHGCVSKEQRLEAEKMLKKGELRVMAATSSMELGIDVGDIDLVVQIGSPLSVSSLMQRLGRAGHSPGRVSRMRMYSKTAQDTLFCALTAKAAMDKKIEPILELTKPLDLMCQHLVSMAATGEYTVSEAAAILKNAWAYRFLSEDDVRCALSLLAGDYEHALDKPVRARVLNDRIHDTFKGDKYTSLLALSSGGTIPDRGWYAVFTRDGTRLGELDEEYVFEARLGDKFMLGAFPWVIVDITRDAVIVDKTTPSGAASPFWKGDGSLRFYETGRYFGKILASIDEAARHSGRALDDLMESMRLTKPAAETVKRVVKEQISACQGLATDKRIILEHFSDEASDHQMMVHCVFGGRVNRALGMLLSREASILTGVDARAYDDDDGILITMIGGIEVPGSLFSRISLEDVDQALAAMMPSTPMFSIAFRQNAQRAMLMGARNGRRQPLWVQRLRASETLTDAIRSKNHPLIHETIRECMTEYLDISALKEVLKGVRSGEIEVREIYADAPSPMSLNLRRAAEAELMYDTVIPTAAKTPLNGDEISLPPEKGAFEESFSPAGKAIENADQAHAYLMMTGDHLSTGETPIDTALLDELCDSNRALYIEPGLWIAREHEKDYEDALLRENPDALNKIIRRLARYKGLIDANIVFERYFISEEAARCAIARLEKAGDLIPFENMWAHKDVYHLAQRKTLSVRRARIETAPGESYAAALLSGVQKHASADRQMEDALFKLSGEAFPAEIYDNSLFPARVDKYRPQTLDAALSKGIAQYAVDPSTLTVSFHTPEDEADEFPPVPSDLTENENAVYDYLKKRGASFSRSMAGVLSKGGAGEALMSLLKRGLVRSDSFAPVRYLKSGETGNLKGDVRRRVMAIDSGRWEAVRRKREKTDEEILSFLFDRFMIVSKETASSDSWPSLLSALRRMEYEGRVRRGYFVKGMSGAQFVRESDYESVVYRLKSPAQEYRVLSAADPLQPYGKILSHMEGRAFTRLASSAVVFFAGTPVAIFEKSGESLRIFDPAHAKKAVSAFVLAFKNGAVYPHLKRITVKSYDKAQKDALLENGFQPDMMDMTLFRI
ncbi:MAG: DEAD/DEAH box helicase [Clostridia bacterium]|nr:DEAD/DEAH box helicase [Clostridia bacterium]